MFMRAQREYTTSSALKSAPSCHLTPLLHVQVHLKPFSLGVQSVSKAGIDKSERSAETSANPLKITEFMIVSYQELERGGTSDSISPVEA